MKRYLTAATNKFGFKPVVCKLCLYCVSALDRFLLLRKRILKPLSQIACSIFRRSPLSSVEEKLFLIKFEINNYHSGRRCSLALSPLIIYYTNSVLRFHSKPATGVVKIFKRCIWLEN